MAERRQQSPRSDGSTTKSIFIAGRTTIHPSLLKLLFLFKGPVRRSADLPGSGSLTNRLTLPGQLVPPHSNLLICAALEIGTQSAYYLGDECKQMTSSPGLAWLTHHIKKFKPITWDWTNELLFLMVFTAFQVFLTNILHFVTCSAGFTDYFNSIGKLIWAFITWT